MPEFFLEFWTLQLNKVQSSMNTVVLRNVKMFVLGIHKDLYSIEYDETWKLYKMIFSQKNSKILSFPHKGVTVVVRYYRIYAVRKDYRRRTSSFNFHRPVMRYESLIPRLPAGVYSLPIPKKISGRGSRVIPTQPAAAHGAVALYDQFATAPPPFRYAYARGEATPRPTTHEQR